MKHIQCVILLFSLLFLFSSCDSDNNCFDIKGNIITQEYEIGSIEGVIVTVPGDMIITHGNDYKLEIRTHEDFFPVLDVIEQNDLLRIQTDECMEQIENFQIFLTVPDLNKIEWIGAGNVRTSNDIDWENLSVDLIGAGNMEFAGEVENFEFTLQGAGNLNAYDLITQNATIRIIGSGNAHITCEGELNVIISGVGNVFYKGDPNTQINISGVGEIIKAD